MLVTLKQVAGELNISQQCLSSRVRKSKNMPVPVLMKGRAKFYDKTEMNNWNKQFINTTVRVNTYAGCNAMTRMFLSGWYFPHELQTERTKLLDAAIKRGRKTLRIRINNDGNL